MKPMNRNESLTILNEHRGRFRIESRQSRFHDEQLENGESLLYYIFEHKPQHQS